MGREVITVWMGMRRVLWRQGGLFQGFMARMGEGMIGWVVAGILPVPVPVHAGS